MSKTMSKKSKTKKSMTKKSMTKKSMNKKSMKNKTMKHHKGSAKSVNDLLKKLLKLQQQVKFFHWNTKEYSAHKITDAFNTKLSALIDELVEVSMGHKMKLLDINKYYGKVREFKTKKDVMDYVDSIQKQIAMMHKKNIKHDVKALLDVIVAELNRFKYLFVMK